MKAYSVDWNFGILLIEILFFPIGILYAVEPSKPTVFIHVTPEGEDTGSGTAENPLATLGAAQRLARDSAGRQPVSILPLVKLN
jgi:hypothetical protein